MIRKGMMSSGARGYGSPKMIPMAMDAPASSATNTTRSRNVFLRFWSMRS
jgi:hypothetical protein